ncbi:MAG: hypothetical protein HY720_02520 [Planctomycetes bacterium]|nr:hypothetical protein [Planctomycetota bacterium]
MSDAPEIVRLEEPDARSAPARGPLYRVGELAVYNGLLTQCQLDECLKIQEGVALLGLYLRLGKVLLLKFYLDRPGLTALLKAQVEGRGLPLDRADLDVDVLKFTQAEHEELVERVRERKLVSPETIDRAIEIQAYLAEQGIDLELGEILVEMGFLSKSAVDDILASRTRIRRRLGRDATALADASPVEDSGVQRAVDVSIDPERLAEVRRFRLGRLAALKGAVPADRVRECLGIQIRLKELGVVKRLGEIFVEKGYLQVPELARLLAVQKRNLSRIRWVDPSESLGRTENDRLLAGALVENSILPEEEVRECCYVQRILSGLGLEETLAEVLVDKEYMDAEVVAAIGRGLGAPDAERAPGEEGERNRRLRKAYGEILSHARFKHLVTIGFERPDLAGAAAKSVRTAALRSAPTRRSRIVANSLAAIGSLAAVGVTLLVFFLPYLLEAPPLPPSPPRAPRQVEARYDLPARDGAVAEEPPPGSGSPESESPEDSSPPELALEGRIEELAFYPPLAAGQDGVFDFILIAEATYYVVRGPYRQGEPVVSDLERRASAGGAVRVRGVFRRRDDGAPASPLPDGTWTREFLDFQSMGEPATS